MSQSERDARRARAVQTTQPAIATGQSWVGWVCRPAGSSFEWVRVEVPAADLPRVQRGRVEPADMRAMVAARIGDELASDKLVTRTPWR